MNPFRNEFTLKLGGEEILLRPTFENIAALEAAVGSISHLAYTYSKGMRLAAQAKASGSALTPEQYSSAMPKMTELAAIVYFCQAAKDPDDSTKRKLSQDQIWDLMQVEGISVTNQVIAFIGRITSGGNNEVKEEKKS